MRKEEVGSGIQYGFWDRIKERREPQQRKLRQSSFKDEFDKNIWLLAVHLTLNWNCVIIIIYNCWGHIRYCGDQEHMPWVLAGLCLKLVYHFLAMEPPASHNITTLCPRFLTSTKCQRFLQHYGKHMQKYLWNKHGI